MNNKFIVRSLSEKDIPSILLICRESFPNSLRWSDPSRAGVKWWKSIIDSKSAKVFVISKNNELCGFCVLVLDTLTFSKEIKSLKIRVREIAKIISRNPKLILKQSRKVFKTHLLFYKNRGSYKNLVTINANQKAGIYLIAVSSKHRRRKLSKLIYDYIEQVCLSNGLNVISSTIQSDNYASIKMHKKFGFKFHSFTKSGLFFIKKIQ